MRPAVFLAIVLLIRPAAAQSPLPGTTPLGAATGDERSRAMVAGIDRFAMQLIDEAAKERQARWKSNLADTTGRDGFLDAMRARLRSTIGLVDEVVPNPGLQKLSADPQDRPLAETADWAAWYVRWPVFDGVDGTGVLLRPKGRVRASVICVPDADETPQSALFGKHALVEAAHHGAEFASLGCEVVVPMLINHDSAASGSERFKVKTNVPHREWIYRQSFILGRNIGGYEVASLLALIEAMEGANLATRPPLGIAGHGEGGWLALFTAALDDRVKSTWVSRCFTPRETIWQEPLDRNAFGFVTDFGAAELGAMILPRRLTVSLNEDPREFVFANEPEAGRRAVGAPFKLGPFLKADADKETARLRDLRPGAKTDGGSAEFLAALGVELKTVAAPAAEGGLLPMVAADWQFEQVRQLQDFTQKLIPHCEHERNANFWKKLPLQGSDAYEKHAAGERERFWRDVIGKLPDSSMPVHPRSRLVSENESFTEYEVMLDVWPDVVAWGHLLLPKNIGPGEKRPVVVCQHGLEGLPEDVANEDEKSKAWGPYKGFAAKLAREGFITFAPHNFYRGKDDFRVIQRKLNLTGKTLFSVIIGQHQRILEWLKAQPQVDAKRIAFYGLSYGGKSAMRIPAVLTDYCLSICSARLQRMGAQVRQPGHAHELCVHAANTRSGNGTSAAPSTTPRWPPSSPRARSWSSAATTTASAWTSGSATNTPRSAASTTSSASGTGRRSSTSTDPHTINGKGTFKFLRRWLDWPAAK